MIEVTAVVATPNNVKAILLYLHPTHQILTDRGQVRQYDSGEGFEELVASIARYGIRQPIEVELAHPQDQETAGEGAESSQLLRYRVVTGHRRLAAAKRLGLASVPCVLNSATLSLSELQRLSLQLSENRLRQPTDPWDEAIAVVTAKTLLDIEQAKHYILSLGNVALPLPDDWPKMARVKDPMVGEGLGEDQPPSLRDWDGTGDLLAPDPNLTNWQRLNLYRVYLARLVRLMTSPPVAERLPNTVVYRAKPVEVSGGDNRVTVAATSQQYRLTDQALSSWSLVEDELHLSKSTRLSLVKLVELAPELVEQVRQLCPTTASGGSNSTSTGLKSRLLALAELPPICQAGVLAALLPLLTQPPPPTSSPSPSQDVASAVSVPVVPVSAAEGDDYSSELNPKLLKLIGACLARPQLRTLWQGQAVVGDVQTSATVPSTEPQVQLNLTALVKAVWQVWPESGSQSQKVEKATTNYLRKYHPELLLADYSNSEAIDQPAPDDAFDFDFDLAATTPEGLVEAPNRKAETESHFSSNSGENVAAAAPHRKGGGTSSRGTGAGRGGRFSQFGTGNEEDEDDYDEDGDFDTEFIAPPGAVGSAGDPLADLPPSLQQALESRELSEVALRGLAQLDPYTRQQVAHLLVEYPQLTGKKLRRMLSLLLKEGESFEEARDEALGWVGGKPVLDTDFGSGSKEASSNSQIDRATGSEGQPSTYTGTLSLEERLSVAFSQLLEATQSYHQALELLMEAASASTSADFAPATGESTLRRLPAPWGSMAYQTLGAVWRSSLISLLNLHLHLAEAGPTDGKSLDLDLELPEVGQLLVAALRAFEPSEPVFSDSNRRLPPHLIELFRRLLLEFPEDAPDRE